MDAVPLAVTVVCPADGCPVGGRPARVYLRRVALGVVEWPTLVCERCGSHMAWKDEDEMAKITRHGGPSDVNTDPPVEVSAAAEPAPAAAETAETEPVPTDSAPALESATETPTDVAPEPADVPAEQTEAAPTETEPVAEVPADPPAPARGRGRPRKATA